MDEDIAPPSFAGILTASNTDPQSTSASTGNRTELQKDQPQTAAEATETGNSPTSEVDENTNANQSPADKAATKSDGGTHGEIQPLILPNKPIDPPRHFAPRRRPRPTRQSRSDFGGTIKRMSNLPKSRVSNRKSAEQAGYRANRKRIKDVYRR
jgi:hypothetical protein